MRRHGLHYALILSVATTLVVVVPAPAHAAPFDNGDVIAGGTTWNVLTNGNPRVRGATNDGWGGNGITFDSGIVPYYVPTGSTFGERPVCPEPGIADLSTATDGTGDQIVTCALNAFDSGNGTLDAIWEQRFFSDGATVRSRWIITNNTDQSVDGATVQIRDNYYQDDDTRVGATTTAGDAAPESTMTVNGDLLWITYDILEDTGLGVPVVLTAAGTANADVPPVMGESVGNGDDVALTVYPLIDLAPGQTVEIVQFTVWNLFDFDQVAPGSAPESGATDAAAPIEQALLEPSLVFAPAALVAVTELWNTRDRFDSLSARDAAGIADPTAVLNWGPAVETEAEPEPELAATGTADAAPLTALAGLLLLAGATVVVIRRRAVRPSR